MISVSYLRSSRSCCISASRMPSVISLIAVLFRDPISEAHLVAHQVTHVGAQLLRDAPGDCARRQPPRLGVADHLPCAAAHLEADLRQLGGLAGTGLSGNDHHLMRMRWRARSPPGLRQSATPVGRLMGGTRLAGPVSVLHTAGLPVRIFAQRLRENRLSFTGFFCAGPGTCHTSAIIPTTR